MEPHHETSFPATLCRWVGEIVQSSPEAARLTLLELIVGALLASGGHVTQAILALTPRLGWQAYHWMLERGRFRLLGLIRFAGDCFDHEQSAHTDLGTIIIKAFSRKAYHAVPH